MRRREFMQGMTAAGAAAALGPSQWQGTWTADAESGRRVSRLDAG